MRSIADPSNVSNFLKSASKLLGTRKLKAKTGTIFIGEALDNTDMQSIYYKVSALS